MALVVARENLGELFERQLSALWVESRAPPGRVGQRAQEQERVLPQPPELLHDSRRIGLRVLQPHRGPVVIQHPERRTVRKRHLREALLVEDRKSTRLNSS